jgi:YD repeat-containing protein
MMEVRRSRTHIQGYLRKALRRIAECLVLCTILAANAYGTSPCYQWRLYIPGHFDSGYQTSILQATQLAIAFCNAQSTGLLCSSCYQNCTFTLAQPVVPVGNWPDQWWYQVSWSGQNSLGSPISGTGLTASYQERTNPAGCQCYVSVALPAAPQCGPTCNGVGHPINPASGAVYDMIADAPESANTTGFKRFYNSTDTGGGDFSSGWRHSFSRNIQPKYGGTDYRPYEQTQDNSSLYTDEATACASGFAEIKARSSTWANATASYANGVCSLSVGNTRIGTLAILYTSTPTPNPSTLTLVGLDSTRDDGQLISFTVSGGTIVSPPSIGLRLQQTSSGYTLQDENDNVEAYDVNGRLLSVATRAGVVQTLTYDSLGRISTVTDSFGHSLILTYDGQNRLSTVNRP